MDSSSKVGDDFVNIKIQDDPYESKATSNLNQSFGPDENEDMKPKHQNSDPFSPIPVESGSGSKQPQNVFKYGGLALNKVKRKPANSFPSKRPN